MMERRAFLSHLAMWGAGFVGAGWSAVSLVEAAPTTRPVSKGKHTNVPLLHTVNANDGLRTLLATKPKDVRFRIAVLTDPHYSLRDKSMDFKVLHLSPWIVQQHISMIQGLGRLTGRNVDLMLMPGDLTRDSEPWNHLAVRTILRSLPFPTMVVPGNHDVMKKWMTPKHWGVSSFVAGYQGKYGGYQGTLPYYANEVTPGLVVIGLNSSDTPDGALRGTWNGRIDAKQVRWFRDTLRRLAGKKQVIVQVHHNLIPHHPAERETSTSVWKNFHTDNADELLKIMGLYGAGLVLTGHHHINRITRHASLPITEITTSGACSTPSTFRVLDIHKDGQHVTVHTVGLPWAAIRTRIAMAAYKDPFWTLPDKPKDKSAFLAFASGRSQDRYARIKLPKAKLF